MRLSQYVGGSEHFVHIFPNRIVSHLRWGTEQRQSGHTDNTPRKRTGSEVERRRERRYRLREDTSRSIVGTVKIEDEGKGRSTCDE